MKSLTSETDLDCMRVLTYCLLNPCLYAMTFKQASSRGKGRCGNSLGSGVVDLSIFVCMVTGICF